MEKAKCFENIENSGDWGEIRGKCNILLDYREYEGYTCVFIFYLLENTAFMMIEICTRIYIHVDIFNFVS